MNTLLVGRWLVWFVVLGGPALSASAADVPPVWHLRPSVQADVSGTYLDELFINPPAPLPHLLLSSLRAGAGQTAVFTRAQIQELLGSHAAETGLTNLTGAEKVRVTRRLRPLAEAEVKQLLTEALQRDVVKGRGELELRFPRPWPALSVPDDPLTLRILDLPTTGISPNFIVRFELSDGLESVGQWQIPLQARIWQEVWVAAAAVPRGQRLGDAALSQERRDVLMLRDPVSLLDLQSEHFEIAETLRAGMPLSSRSVRLRPVIRRGKLADAVISEGALIISVKVEALEDGVPGQTIRVRNVKSKREFRAKVENEETLLVTI